MDAAVLDRLEALQNTLRQAAKLGGHEVKWVRPDQMHLTLKFLGDVEDNDVRQVCAIVQEVAQRYEAFDISCKGVGVFGHPARVVWAGIESSQTLKQMQRELDQRLTQAGWAAENREFAAHLTLCRIKSAAAGKSLAAAIVPFEQDVFGSVWVDSLVVYESRLSSAGPDYQVVSRAPLK